MRAKGLINTGTIIALLDADDQWHNRCVEAFPSLRLPLATSAAVLAELFHLLGDHRPAVNAAWRFLRSGAITVLPITDADLPDLDRLMKRYDDRPMDCAATTLVHLAKSLTAIFTIDHDDFETYLIDGKRQFRIIPSR